MRDRRKEEDEMFRAGIYCRVSMEELEKEVKGS